MLYFNPRSPYGERPTEPVETVPPTDFNPRSPYGERHSEIFHSKLDHNFNPRSPYGERLSSRGYKDSAS